MEGEREGEGDGKDDDVVDEEWMRVGKSGRERERECKLPDISD